MKSFSLHLHDTTHDERIDGVISFVGEDATGSFGILPGHARFMTSLVFGLCRFRVNGNAWRYLALPGAVLYFVDNSLVISTRHYLIDDDYERISTLLQEQLLAEEAQLHAVKESLRRMEESVLKSMWRLKQEGEPYR